MNDRMLLDGLVNYCCLLLIVTFHEFAHAWAAWKCGDDTARLQGRLTLNPLAHMDPLGTVVLPLVAVFLMAADSRMAGFIIGWGKPVPVNPYLFRRRGRDDVLVSLAGPWMNLVLAIGALAVARIGEVAGVGMAQETGYRLALLSLYLAFFNLLPIPPLDGSSVLKFATRMSDETYFRLSQFGFLLVILAIQIPAVRWILSWATLNSLEGLRWLVWL